MCAGGRPKKRASDRLTALVAGLGLALAIIVSAAPASAQQPAGSATDTAREHDQRELTECDTSRDPVRTISACTAVLERRGSNAPTSATRVFVLHKRANAYRERGEYAPAIADYSEVTTLDPNDANAYYNRANVHLLRNDQNAALGDYRKAVELRPGLGVAHVQLGSLLLDRNEARQALDHFEQAVRIDGRDAAALVGRGLARDRLGDLDGAIASLSDALVQAPDTVAYRLMRAQLLRRKGENARALADIDRVIELAPDAVDALIERGTINNARANRDQAIADCSRAIDRSRDNAAAYVCRGLARAGKGDIRAARVDLDRAVQINGSPPEAIVARGFVLYQLGSLDAAVADFRRALAQDPASVDAQRFLGVALIDKGETEAGMRAFDDAIRAMPNDAWLYMLRAVGFAATGNRDSALRDSATAIRLLGDSNSNARLARGVAYYHLGELDNARGDIEAAIRLDASNGQAYNALGRLLIRQREFVRAGEMLDTAARLLPGHWVVLRNRALAALERRDLAVARRDIAASLDISTAFAESFVVRGQIGEAEGQRSAAIADYELALTKLSLDGDGRRAQQVARDRIAALRVSLPTAPGSAPLPTSRGEPGPRTEPVARSEPAPAAPSEPLHCRLLRDWARHAEGYAGVKLLDLDRSCQPR